jgi:hypothetical protein
MEAAGEKRCGEDADDADDEGYGQGITWGAHADNIIIFATGAPARRR